LSLASVASHATLDAPPDAVWAYVTDPDNFAAYVDGYAGGRVTTAERAGIGARYEWVGRAGPLRIAASEEVVEWREGRRIAYRGQAADVSFDSAMEVEPRGGGRSLLRVEIDYRLPARLGGRAIDFLFVRRLVRAHVERSLQRLAQTVA
jgi:uncharacterized protein YndB with AHSA1/START domain